MGYQVPTAAIPAITSAQDKMKRLGLFHDKVDGKPAMSTWEAVGSALAEVKRARKAHPEDVQQFHL